MTSVEACVDGSYRGPGSGVGRQVVLGRCTRGRRGKKRSEQTRNKWAHDGMHARIQTAGTPYVKASPAHKTPRNALGGTLRSGRTTDPSLEALGLIHSRLAACGAPLEPHGIDAGLEHTTRAVLGLAHVLLDVGREEAQVVRETALRVLYGGAHVDRRDDSQVWADDANGVRLSGDVLVFDLEEAPMEPLSIARGVARLVITQTVTAEERFHGGGTLPKDGRLDTSSIARQNPRVILDLVRTTLHSVITTPVGDKLALLRVPKGLARRLNITLGQPLCSSEELEKRRNAVTRLAALREGKGHKSTSQDDARVAAPVMVYFEKDRNPRELVRVEELLKAKSYPYTLLDVAGDEATMSFVMHAAGVKDDDLPVVFVAGNPIGVYRALVEADVSGELKKAIYG
jgi:hypothetical protein